jgi:chromosome segregation ATPase
MLTLYKAIFMNDRIQKSIDSINSKIASFKLQFDNLKSQNESMLKEIQSFKEELHEKSQKETEQTRLIEKLNQELELALKQVIELSQRPTGRTNEEIDELVKEIDYCIEQLKK